MANTKKVKYLGTQEFINTATGEVEKFNVSSIEERDFNFKKVWMRDFLATMDMLGTQKTKVAFWIIEHIKKDNTISFTYDQITKDTKISNKTISVTVNALIEANFMKKAMPSVYHINPNIMFQGSKDQRCYNLNIYQDLDAPKIELSTQEQLQQVLNSINQLQKTAQALQEKLAEELSEKEKSNQTITKEN